MKDKSVLTTGQMAKVVNCSAKSICEICDAGEIKHYRLKAKGKGDGDRRVRREEFVRWLGTKGIPVPDWLMTTRTILLVGADALLLNSFQEGLDKKDYVIQGVPSALKAATFVAANATAAIVIDLSIGRLDAVELLKVVREVRKDDKVVAVAITSEDDGDSQPLQQAGFDLVMQKPLAPTTVALKIVSLISQGDKK